MTKPKTIAELLRRAKTNIEAGESRLRQAAEDIAAASARGATQREIAEAVGKSAAWVNALLKWRSTGYQDTAFGPASKAQREQAAERRTERVQAEPKAERVQATEQDAEHKPSGEQNHDEAAQAKSEKEREERKKASARRRAEYEKARAREEKLFSRFRSRKKIRDRDRTVLVKSLGMLGSDQPGERDAAALMVEKIRKGLGFSWDDLIIEAASVSPKSHSSEHGYAH